MARGIFIAGTDTDIGKTIVTAGLLRVLRSRGTSACSMKPVQTGARREGDGWVAIDLEFHHRAANMTPTPEELRWMAPYCFEPACSPHLAGRMANRYLEIGEIQSCYRNLATRYDLLLVEGAGGLHAPIDETRTMLDLMQALALPVVLVARRGLGTINHSLLSIEAIRARGLTLLGVIFNETENVALDYIRRDNPDAVARFGNTRILGNVDYLEEVISHSSAAWSRFEACVPGIDAIASGAAEP